MLPSGRSVISKLSILVYPKNVSINSLHLKLSIQIIGGEMNFNSTKRAIISSRYFYVPALQNQQAQMMKIVIDFTIYVGWRNLKTKEERVITI